VLRFYSSPDRLAINVAGALLLGFLAVRRRHPVFAIGVVAAAAISVTLVTQIRWPGVSDDATVPILAMMLAAYSVGAHGRGPAVAWGVVLPLLVVLAADLTTMSGWPLVSGVLFISVFVGLSPTIIGRLVRARENRLRLLRRQREEILREQLAERASAVLAERIRTAERLQPSLLAGMRMLAEGAEAGDDPADIEMAARRLLRRAREEVLTLTAPVDDVPGPEMVMPETTAPDVLAALRKGAQPWTVVGAGAATVALAAESIWESSLLTPHWVAVLASIFVGLPLAFASWRPVTAVTALWITAAMFSHLVAPLNGTVTGSGLALMASFLVAALSSRRTAVVGLLVCWMGEFAVSGDLLGNEALILVCWFGGLAINEVSRLAEQLRANNERLAGQEIALAQRAVIDERLRFARELHDVVGHSLTVVALQAGAARRLQPTDPLRARDVVRTIGAVARDGVAALQDGAPASDLSSLVERTRTTGLVVTADLSGEALLMPIARLAARSVVQEGLTNVLRHASGCRASVAVRPSDEGRIEVIVANTAPTGSPDIAGSFRGLAGIRERVAACGGEVTWGSRDDGGFELRALLPAAERAVIQT
jgi:signal transduction histidine kinase